MKNSYSGDLYERSSPFGRGVILSLCGVGIALFGRRFGGDIANPAFGWFVCILGLIVAIFTLLINCIAALKHRGHVDLVDMARIIHEEGYMVLSVGEQYVGFLYEDYLLRVRCLGKSFLVIEYVFEKDNKDEITENLVAASLTQVEYEPISVIPWYEDVEGYLSIGVRHLGNSPRDLRKLLNIAPDLILHSYKVFDKHITEIRKRKNHDEKFPYYI